MLRKKEKITKEKTLELVNIRRPHVDTKIEVLNENEYAVCEHDKESGILHGRTLVVENGLLRELLYFQKGHIHGDCRYYYSDGTRKLFESYRKGKLHGKAQYFDKDGNKIRTEVYEHDNLVDINIPLSECEKLVSEKVAA